MEQEQINMQATKVFKADGQYSTEDVSILPVAVLQKNFDKQPLKDKWTCKRSINVNLSIIELAN